MPDQKKTTDQPSEPCAAATSQFLLNRRQFLFGAGAGLIALTMPEWLQETGLPARMQAQLAEYPRRSIGKLSELVLNEPVNFNYPWDHFQATNFLIKLPEQAGGGVGPDKSVVAFNSFCTHQGMTLQGTVKGDIGVVGPCPLHWTTFDLTRHGTVIGGHATLGLPQIVLETEGDEIIATGVMGLIFGYYDNKVDPTV